ncbi:hypothetical protein LFX15_18485 [Leptospira levettii]|uniref:hypothetical protein n=1 Tax=Leptospira levettii TaxID=2023178 RepID=UPI001EEA1107|nr:hypothetical protein [Leptospira levettii]MCG6150292.1 hypothetical protein [Leptospira levettii]
MAIIEKNGNFYLEGVKTPGKNAVYSSNRNLIERIEETENGVYKAKKFGLFSMYCTYRDFIDGFGLMYVDEAFSEMTQNDPFFTGEPDAENMLQFPTDGVREKLRSLFDSLGIPKSFLDTPDPKNLYQNQVSSVLSKIPSEKLTAFVILNGHLQAPMSLLLLFLHDMYTIEDFKSNPYQFDSKENAHYYITVEVVKSWLEIFETEKEKTGYSK